MKCLFKKLIIVSLVLVMVSGCATMNNDGTRTTAEGTAVGVGVGAAVGAGIGALLGGRDGAKLGAGIGAALGGVGGYVAGSMIADRKQKYANEEDRLNGEIQVVAQYNKELEDFNSKTANRIKTLDNEVSNLKARNSESLVNKFALAKKKFEINRLIKEANGIKESKNKEVVALEEYQKIIVQAQDQANAAKLDTEVRALKEKIAMLDTNNSQMAQMVESLTIRK